jgi:hypothetical protein
VNDTYRDAAAYAMRLANKSAYDRFRIRDALLRHGYVLGVQERYGIGRALKLATKIADKALAHVEVVPPELVRFQAPKRIIRYRRAADARPWRGRTGAVDRRCLEAAFLSGLISRSTKFGLSARTWGLRAGVGRMEANRSAHRLERAGWITRTCPGAPNIAARYKLERQSVTDGVTTGPTVTFREVVLVGVHMADPTGIERVLLCHDAFRDSALASEGWLISKHLLPKSALALDEIVANTGISERAICHTLDALELHGAVIRTEAGYVAVIESLFLNALDTIAAEAGTLGDLERDREAYQRERERRDEDTQAGVVTLHDVMEDTGAA